MHFLYINIEKEDIFTYQKNTLLQKQIDIKLITIEEGRRFIEIQSNL